MHPYVDGLRRWQRALPCTDALCHLKKAFFPVEGQSELVPGGRRHGSTAMGDGVRGGFQESTIEQILDASLPAMPSTSILLVDRIQDRTKFLREYMRQLRRAVRTTSHK
jgi:hypothetical protein